MTTTQHRPHPTLHETNRLEDLTWLAHTGETTHGAAHRLGISHDALEKWCRSPHHPHRLPLWHHLTRNTNTPGHGARHGHITLHTL